MLAEGHTTTSSAPARLALALLVLVLFLGAVPPAARAGLPTTVTNANGTRTVTWTMDGPENLTVDHTVIAGGQAFLPWVSQNVSWSQASDFRANGTLGPRMVANGSGLGLQGNWSNYVQDGLFADAGSWGYVGNATANVTSGWNATAHAADLGANGTGAESLWEPMDNVAAHWAGSGAAVVQNTTNPPPVQGSGSMGIGVVSPGVSSAGAVNSSLVSLNWSEFDRAIFWVYLNASVSATFNLTAHAGLSGPVLSTVAQPLATGRGWQEVVVDLDELGNASTRSDLFQIALHFNAPTTFPAGTWFNVDDVSLGVARVFQASAYLSQIVYKANVTSSVAGSAHFSFDWTLTRLANVTLAAASVSLGPFVASLPTGPLGVPHSFSADVSPSTTAAGYYGLEFALFLNVNTTARYVASLRIDNVTLVFPEISNATYVSNVLSLGRASEYLSLGWSGTAPPSTSVRVGVRSGNASTPTPGSWSAWQTTSSPGITVPLSLPGALNFQIEVVMTTTNASLSPELQSLALATSHRGSSGNVTTAVAYPASNFLWWRSFAVHEVLPANTSILFKIGDGSSWTGVQPGANLTGYTLGPNLFWQANLLSADGLATPSLFNVTLVYDFQGPPARVAVTQGGVPVGGETTVSVTTGESVSFGALVYDAGNHPLSLAVYPVAWSIDNGTGGSVAQNGTYLAGKPGVWHVIATVVGTGVFASVRVNVSESASGSTTPALSLWDLWPALAIALGAIGGFSIYELVIRRLFAIDDVFLIAKDGRLIIHNTRRMRADRDEDILSGMLTAIMAFLRDQDPEENGELRRFQVGGKTTLLERGEHVYLSAIYSGRVPGWAGKDLHRFMTDLEDRFGAAFASWSGSPEDLQDLKAYMQRFVSHVRYRGDSSAHRTEN